MGLSQWVLDGLLALHGPGRWRRLASVPLATTRAVLVALGDPPIRYRAGGTMIELPLSHQLPFHQRAFPLYSRNLARLGALIAERYPNSAFVDIGANVGDSVAIVRQVARFSSLCVEGNPAFLPYLRRNAERLGDIEIESAFVSAEETSDGLDLVTRAGTARLVPGSGSHTARSIESILHDHPRFRAAKFVKSDTDGMDCQIVATLGPLVERSRPVIFFEYDPDLTRLAGAVAFDVFAHLLEFGYDEGLVYDNVGDLLVRVSLSDRRLLRDLDAYFSGRASARYADVCVFHKEDGELAEAAHRAELSFFAAMRSG